MKFILLPFFMLLCVLTTAQAQHHSKSDLSVYPNPIVEHFSLNDHNDQAGYIAVINLVGKKVKEFPAVKGEQYWIGDLPKGMYLIQVLDRSRKILNTNKVDKR
jgi:hypothetical protein